MVEGLGFIRILTEVETKCASKSKRVRETKGKRPKLDLVNIIVGLVTRPTTRESERLRGKEGEKGRERGRPRGGRQRQREP
jgi:hypothetical protein